MAGLPHGADLAPHPPGLPQLAAAVDRLRHLELALVGIGGRGCAGKTTLAAALPDVEIVATDEFWDGAGFDLARLRDEVIAPLRAGRAVGYPRRSWMTGEPLPVRAVAPRGVIVVEGVCALHRTLRETYDLRVWVEAPAEERLRRAAARDGDGALEVRRRRWEPSESDYVDRDRPIEAADLILPG